MAIYPFIFLRNPALKDNPRFMRHERIHLRQQVEMLCLPFFVWYGLEFLIRLVQYRNADAAYRNISFEREAYRNQDNPHYLRERTFWRFLRFI